MKRCARIASAILFLAFMLTGCNMAMLNGLTGGGGKSGGVDKESLMKQAKIISDTIIAGYMSMLEAKKNMYAAAGLDGDASKMNDQILALKKSPDKVDEMHTADLDSTMSNVNTDEALKQIDYNNKEAKKHVKSSAINAIVAVAYDAYAGKNIDDFISRASKAISSDPMGLAELKPHLELAQKVAPKVPDQISEMTKMVKYYTEYAKDKSIMPISKSEVDTKAAKIKEDLGTTGAQMSEEGTEGLMGS